MKESLHTYEWVMPHTRVCRYSKKTCLRLGGGWVMSCRTYACVMSHIWMSHVTHMNESCHTYDRVLSQIWKNHFTRTNELFHTFKCVSIARPRQLIGCLKPQVTFHKRATRYRALLRKRSSKDKASYGSSPVVNVGKCLCWGDGWVMSHIWTSCHTYERHVTHMNEWFCTIERVMSHIWMSHVTYMNESCHTYEWVMSHI